MLQCRVQSTKGLLKVWNKITVQCACFNKNFRKGTTVSHYDVLGVPLYSTDKEIRKAFIELSKKYHPDADASDKTLHDKFVKINKAYNVLISHSERKIYDEGLRAGLHVEPDEVSTKQNWNPNHPQFYYHPRFYQDPEMRKMAAKVWEKNTGYSYSEYGTGKEYQRPKNLGLKAFLMSSVFMSLGLMLAYRQYRYAQEMVHKERVRTVENYERSKRKGGIRNMTWDEEDRSEEKDLTEDPLSRPLVYMNEKELKT